MESIVLTPLTCIYTGPGSLLPVSNTGSLIPEYGNIVIQLSFVSVITDGYHCCQHGGGRRGGGGGVVELLESHFSDYMDLKEPFAQEHNSLWKV